jgi:hypothetical protein
VVQSPEVEADHLSSRQRWTIRRAVQDAVAEHGAEGAMRNTCAELERKYGISYDAIVSLMGDDLPAALPEELLSTTQNSLSALVGSVLAPHRRSRDRVSWPILRLARRSEL